MTAHNRSEFEKRVKKSALKYIFFLTYVSKNANWFIRPTLNHSWLFCYRWFSGFPSTIGIECSYLCGNGLQNQIYSLHKNVEMEPLETNQRVMTWLCIFPTSSKLKRRFFVSLILLTIVSLCLIAVSSTIFLIEFLSSDDIANALYALFQIIDTAIVLYAVLCVYLSRHRIPSIFSNLKKIYRSSEN